MFETSSARATPKFEQRFQQLDQEVQRQISEKLKDFLENYSRAPWNHPDVKRIESMEVWRLKVGERNCDVDHRVFFDIEGSEIEFLTVRHRDEAYDSDI